MKKKYRCTKCGYIYNPDKGHPASNISEGTLFEDIPEHWRCPFCGVTKSYFDPLDEE